MIRKALAATLLVSAQAFAATPAHAVVSWASWTGPVANEQECITKARDAAARLPGQLNITSNLDYQADTALEIEVTRHNGADVRVVALFLCQDAVAVIMSFGEPYDTAEALRNTLRDTFIGRPPANTPPGGAVRPGGGKPR